MGKEDRRGAGGYGVGIDVRVNESMLYFVPLRCHVGACACAFVCVNMRVLDLVLSVLFLRVSVYVWFCDVCMCGLVCVCVWDCLRPYEYMLVRGH